MTTAPAYELLQVDEHEDRLQVILNRPAARNAINAAMVAELHRVCDELETRPRLLILTGAGDAFAAGADLHELHRRHHGDALQGINSRLFDRIASLPLPTIAAINGPALGGGGELAYACDFRIASANARIGNPEVSLGILAAAGACWRLQQLVSSSLAREMLLAGRVLTATEALSAGLVSQVVPPETLMHAARDLADRIARGAPLALRLTKLALAAPFGSHPRFDEVAQALLFELPDKEMRIQAFMDRKQ
jgi:enoyl-CoA hydratase